jgi:hypothetical protein
MNKYETSYNNITRTYKANSAMQAIEKFERQNHVTVSVIMIDPDTQGTKYAAGWVQSKTYLNPAEWIEMHICD